MSYIYFTTPRLFYWREFRKANGLIHKIEEYRKINGTLPSSLEEVGEEVSESGPIYYELLNNGEYKIWFGLRLGESMIYSSSNGKWE